MANFAIVVAALILAAPFLAEAQRSAQPPRLCLLAAYPVSPEDGQFLSFFDGLRELGYIPGRSVTIDSLSADGRFERFDALVAECLRRNSDIIVAFTTPAALAAKKATSTVPIVMPALGDPVATGLVASLARPGGNVTGLTIMASGLSAKRLALLKEAVPGLRRAVVLSNFGDPIAPAQVKELEDAAHSLARLYRVRST